MEGYIHEIVCALALLTPAMKSLLRPSDFFILKLQNNCERSCHLMLEIADVFHPTVGCHFFGSVQKDRGIFWGLGNCVEMI